jgi:hypothetical protein
VFMCRVVIDNEVEIKILRGFPVAFKPTHGP